MIRFFVIIPVVCVYIRCEQRVHYVAFIFGKQILEPRFSSETLALLLNIPPQKTLLRRHLATAFSALVGLQAMQEKREYGNATGHVPLTTTAKVKVRSLFKSVKYYAACIC